MVTDFTKQHKEAIGVCIVLILFILFLRECRPLTKPDNKVTIKEVRDTTEVRIGPDIIYLHDSIPVIRKVFYSEPIKSIAPIAQPFGQYHDSGYNAYRQGYNDATEALAKMKQTCRDTTYYNDTIAKDNWRLYLSEWITGNKLIKRVPIVTTLVTYIKDSSTVTLPPKPERIRFYVGGQLLVNTNYLNRWDAGISGLLTLPRGLAFNYTYGLHNNTHAIGAYILIKLKK